MMPLSLAPAHRPECSSGVADGWGPKLDSSFYDELAPFYHLLYGDWDVAVQTQGSALATLLEGKGIRPGGAVLDTACGIGTQALGLAARGYRVRASDVSAGSVTRLAAEAAQRGFDIPCYVDDLRLLTLAANDSADAILACDNSLPHLLTDEHLLEAFRSALRVLKPNGVTVYSVRDYLNLPRKNPDVRPYNLRYDGEDRLLTVQVWEWHGDQYDLRMYLTREFGNGECSTRVLVTRYYAISIDRLMELMSQAGFVSVERRDDVLFQPVILGQKRSS
jgi:SAM-dependent methyltransferase